MVGNWLNKSTLQRTHSGLFSLKYGNCLFSFYRKLDETHEVKGTHEEMS